MQTERLAWNGDQIFRAAVAFAGDAVFVGVESVGVARISAQDELRLCLAREVGAVVAIAACHCACASIEYDGGPVPMPQQRAFVR